MRGSSPAHDDGCMWTEGPAVPAAAQRTGRHSACRIKHDSEYTAKDRSTVVTAASYSTAIIFAPGDTAANDGARSGEQEGQQRPLATAEVGGPYRRTRTTADNSEIVSIDTILRIPIIPGPS